jgi:hypothetical protein
MIIIGAIPRRIRTAALLFSCLMLAGQALAQNVPKAGKRGLGGCVDACVCHADSCLDRAVEHDRGWISEDRQ